MSFKAMWLKIADLYEQAAQKRRDDARALVSDQLYNGQRIFDEHGKARTKMPAEAVVMMRVAQDLESFAADIRRELRAV